jgi:hypothetical protein
MSVAERSAGSRERSGDPTEDDFPTWEVSAAPLEYSAELSERSGQRDKRPLKLLKILLREGTLARMARCEDGDRLPGLVDLVDHNVLSRDEPPNVRLGRRGEPTSHPWLVGQSGDTVEKILDDTLCGGGVVLGDEVKELGSAAQRCVRPENAVRHYL